MTPVVTWRQLRELAEKVQGNQHQDLGIDVVNNELVVEKMVAGKKYVATVPKTASVPKSRALNVLLDPPVLVGTSTQAQDNITQTADAAFWSLAAVEKFLLPYYASFKDSGTYAQQLLAEFAKPEVVAILHLPNSEPTIARGVDNEFFAVVAPTGPEKATPAPHTLRRIL